MRLNDWLKRYPGVRLAGPEDNAALRAFFEEEPMRTSEFDIRYRRAPHFFKLLGYQSDTFFVFMGDGENGNIHGTGTLILRPGWMDGKLEIVGALTDLRIRSGRKTSRLWRIMFRDLLHDAEIIEELCGCRHFYTVILDRNRDALRAFDGTRHFADPPHLVPVGSFTMRNLLLRKPWARTKGSAARWEIRKACQADIGAIDRLFVQQNQTRPFGFHESVSHRLAKWDGLAITDFYCAFDPEGLAACFAPWSPTQAKQTWVSRLPRALRILKALSVLCPMLPLRIPAAGEDLNAPSLTHLLFSDRLTPADRNQVFRGLLHRLFDEWGREEWHCISFPDFKAWNLGQGLSDFVQQTVPITVYAVLTPGAVPPDFSRHPAIPGFEMALV